MSKLGVVPENDDPLRQRAEALLQVGAAPKSRTAALGTNALSLLQGMATGPDSASAVLKLLHEFQVHQVELDLQQEQLERSCEELSHALSRYVERFDAAPIGYFLVQRDGRIIEGNRAAADLFAIEREALSGRSIDSLVTAQCRLALRGLMKRLCSGSTRETCEAQADTGTGVFRHFQVVATASPGDQSLMMMFVETTARQND